ncbi:Oxysterol-binding protein-related protein 1D [Hibiscus syriacus]|uniref:Oxysterol-binding protein-related protein 1D n=1 Tax=Hibiscus syriacus TaxID=106335 RepID=A0A6A3BWW1_HIBSY|nr:oxysterol-binding protein-related protein 1C-like [Hibiscus syriacus]KAE8721105.1 Oxysterol-binding protein-related protein 1D [Hibiscus syriacus]
MHPFCCVSTVPECSPVKPLADQVITMAPPPVTTTSSSAPASRSNSARSTAQIQCHSDQNHHRSSSVDLNRLVQRNGIPSGREGATATAPPPQVDVKINDIVGNGISGVLYKWVNYGKGWRSRWFVLQDGVLSYYKIHGPDKILVNQETEKGSKVIGDESLRIISRHRNSISNHSATHRKPFGEVHLKVSSIRESRSDDKRFSIFTGTKRLHLRAETREDRVAWMEALQAVKDMFPRMSNSELMAPMDNVVVSVEKLRKRLMRDGVSEPAIQDCEQIMRSEFAELQKQLILLKQKQWLLIDTLRQLETEKVDLENTVVDESQSKLNDQGASSIRQDKSSEGSVTDTDEDNERVDAAEEETDEDEHNFFDTRDFLSSSSFKSNGSDFRTSSFSSDDGSNAFDSEDDIDPCIKSVGSNFPYIKRRKKLPDPVEKEKGVSLWSMIKDNIGKDLTKVCLPVYFNEPLSSLQKCFEDLEFSYLLDRAYEWGKRGNNLMRILNVAAFAVSGYSSTEGRICKPFNPLLGETYEADFPDKGLRFFSEKVSHHPMIVACHCQGTGWKLWGDSNLKSKFWGRSIQLDPVGVLTLEFDDGEVFQWSKVTTSIYNLILGKLYCDHYGTMRIEGNCEYSCKLKFKEQSIIDRNPHQVHGIVQDRNGRTVASLLGKWDESMHYVIGDYYAKGKGQESFSETHTLWKRSKPPKYPTRCNLTRFAITLNELTPGLKEKLPPTDSRLRPDQRYLETGEYEMANSEKLRLEQRQRQARKMQESGWKPRWFAKDKSSDTYRYIGGYWEAREKGKWDSCPDIFGQIPSDHPLD